MDLGQLTFEFVEPLAGRHDGEPVCESGSVSNQPAPIPSSRRPPEM